VLLNFIDDANKLPLSLATLHELTSHYGVKLQSGPCAEIGSVSTPSPSAVSC